MVQGKVKKKTSLPSGAKGKGGRQHRKTSIKRGGKIIKPKKTKLIEAAKLKRGLQKAINSDIEHMVSMKAVSTEPKQFHVFKADKTASASSSKPTPAAAAAKTKK
ncbi:UPF0390 protein zgc136864-like [Mizuhopecten yessoensis]|uniref:Leydig cell tumor 10 kDa protein-like n=1 Tax=Mizuhopecten yessoensis TaxID=6573 RepID=A0A210Q4K9_MIZYE|nr:UPF0390 protein zgc136864-like [Mizuhopecten yessoensis]OWF43667.1 hypothetical protein KP79_PYT16750 [Mizuhopecten yessoensis]